MAVQRIVRANYTIPAGLHLSEQCLDLWRRIFVVAPTERITLEGIQQHPWFLQNLPLQLQVRSRPSGPRLPMRLLLPAFSLRTICRTPHLPP